VGLLAFLGMLGAGLIGYALIGRTRAHAAGLQTTPRMHRWPPPIGPGISTASRAPVSREPPHPELPGWRPPGAPATPPAIPTPGPADDAPIPATGRERIRPPSLEAWGLMLAPGCIASGIQLSYAIQWLALESGGNPCAVGYPSSRGPDGYPREMGIAQFYNPDDLQRLGLTSSELRAYCVPGDQHETTWRGKKIRGFSSKLARPLTSSEMQRQADATVSLISWSMTRVRQILTSIGAGAAWSPTRRDFWRLVKLEHGLPVLISEGLIRINAKLGRAPRDWEEFKQGIDMVTLGARGEEKRRQGLFPRVFENAEKCASAFDERSVS
jgi:hypothetical protein